MKRLVNYFVQGLVLIVPLALTLYVCYLVFATIDGFLAIRVPRIGRVPGLGFLLTVGVITLVGFMASAFATRKALNLLERAMNRVPLVRLLYSSSKDLLNAFVGEKRRFDKPVLITLTKDNDLKILGFVTQESLDTLGMPGYVAVYFPQSYNFAGNLFVVPRLNVERIEAESSTVMAFIVSGGVTDVPALEKAG